MSQSPSDPMKKVVGFRRTWLPGTRLAGPDEPIFEGDAEEAPPGRKIVGWKPTKIEGTELVGPSIPIYEDDVPKDEGAA